MVSFECDAFRHKGERVVERVNLRFEVEDAHVHEVHLGSVQAIDGIHNRDLDVTNEVLQISRHVGGDVPFVPGIETTKSEIHSRCGRPAHHVQRRFRSSVAWQETHRCVLGTASRRSYGIAARHSEQSP